MIHLEQYLFKMDRELFDLNVMEMDKVLSDFYKKTGVKSDESFEMVNDQGTLRKFKINWEDGTLQGRGIKGFFSPYDAAYLFISQTTDGVIRVSSPLYETLPQENDRDSLNEADGTTLAAIKGFRGDPEIWFQFYQEAQAFLVGANDNQLVCLPYINEIRTFDYQTRTVESILHRFKGRVMLSDEVGLGKTIEAGMAMLEYIMRGLVKKVLILTPPSLVQQWENEMKRKFNQDFIKADDPNFKKMGVQAWSHYKKIIASLSTAKRQPHRQAIANEHYDLVIVDEAHHLRNRKTQAWSFVNAINKKYIFLLTATPVQNHLEELYNLITLLKPGQLRTYRYFKRNFIDSKDGIEVKNSDRLKDLLSDVMIRNKRSNVDVRFTKRKAYTATVELPHAQHELYDDLSTFIRNKYREQSPSISRFQLKNLQEQMGSAFTSMLPTLERLAENPKLSVFDRKALAKFVERARMIMAEEDNQNPKIQQLLEILSRFGDKMIVFTKYKTTQIFLTRLLKKHGLKVAEFHGGLRRMEKEEQVAFFKEQADVLVSTEVGGEGRNLQFCHGMINYDLPWNPMAIEQRIGRIHRIGQTRDVFVYNLVAKDTIEHYILDLLDRKINMFELVVGEVDAILGDIESEEVFSDLMMENWVKADTKEDIEKGMEKIGDRLFENKQQLLKQKELDDRLF
ncbi:SNF2-related protein [Sporolactobacillus sp. STCC-11]|uniref:DEAD/DEAH box helicase n=1 Tax=Sporolactobacillus caesalpiniae TaxID=3230362 RepID=UPI0033947D04